LNPEDFMIHYYLAKLYRKNDQTMKAFEHLELGLKKVMDTAVRVEFLRLKLKIELKDL
jgi:thioredoxin-like negative regulator of GroEL